MEARPNPPCCTQVGEARALYNIGNVYHAKGKQLSWNAAQDPGHLPPDVRETLCKASEFYEHFQTPSPSPTPPSSPRAMTARSAQPRLLSCRLPTPSLPLLGIGGPQNWRTLEPTLAILFPGYVPEGCLEAAAQLF
ncbi:hypothetical protein P7K49_002054 [Saguinus oedipus]|uniref:Uncharacterized protein n=1 Tax=Saguinus oedipus TaxID=9490 RepID=A0ABQ9WIV4_SAGOE|nr:hypothetical protein P7K49_002054 [Saguinus oedipus]